MRRALIGIALTLVACKGGGGPAANGERATPLTGDAAAAVVVAADAVAVDPAVGSDAGSATRDAVVPAIDAGASRAVMPTPPGVMRLVLVHDVPLLRSEEKALQRVVSTLARGTLKGAVVDGGDEEAALLAAWTRGLPPEPMPPLPAAWAAAPLVVVIRVEPPSGVEPKRKSGGLGARVVFRPPATEPIYTESGLFPGDTFDGLISEDGFLSVIPTFQKGP